MNVRSGNKAVLTQEREYISSHMREQGFLLRVEIHGIRDELLLKKGGGPPSIWLIICCSSQQVGKVVTWLILPVVICLSQRLSHACLSINKFVL
jgi:hypothetical protein